MKKHSVKGIDVEASSGNVFADLGLADAEKLQIKPGLVIEIARAVRCLGLTQQEAELGRRPYSSAADPSPNSANNTSTVRAVAPRCRAAKADAAAPIATRRGRSAKS
ncbi:helix-turn-helix protein [Trinickia symbiotica]|nr:helix-turn-helix protein [Trinickia symbiotica]